MVAEAAVVEVNVRGWVGVDDDVEVEVEAVGEVVALVE